MPNIQQPEMRRSGRDPLVQDSAEARADAPQRSGGGTGPVPPDQQSPYGPQPPRERRPDAVATEEEAAREPLYQGDPDAILVGGPHDSTPFHSASAGVVTLERDGLVHRYIRTGATREAEGRELLVYNYDGEVRAST